MIENLLTGTREAAGIMERSREQAQSSVIDSQNAAKSNDELVVLSKQLKGIVSTFKLA